MSIDSADIAVRVSEIPNLDCPIMACINVFKPDEATQYGINGLNEISVTAPSCAFSMFHATAALVLKLRMSTMLILPFTLDAASSFPYDSCGLKDALVRISFPI